MAVYVPNVSLNCRKNIKEILAFNRCLFNCELKIKASEFNSEAFIFDKNLFCYPKFCTHKVTSASCGLPIVKIVSLF
jgi:hypothetical protein